MARYRIAMRILRLLAALVILTPTLHAADTATTLRKQTLELLDAVTAGDAKVWDRYLHADAIITVEDGRVQRKDEMVKGIRPLPKGVSGNLKILDFKLVERASTAITNYLIDEDENYHGHVIHCQYRATDTWVKTTSGWRILASQIHAVRTDPLAMQLSDAQLDAYIGKYALTPELTFEIRRGAKGLESKRGTRDWQPILAEAPDVLFNPGSPRYRMIFQRDAVGRITGFAERREAWDLNWKRMP
ncbi:MAG TPA: nuclear transport factor 2 family protein [Thermoanaerobaculia bacterium]